MSVLVDEETIQTTPSKSICNRFQISWIVMTVVIFISYIYFDLIYNYYAEWVGITFELRDDPEDALFGSFFWIVIFNITVLSFLNACISASRYNFMVGFYHWMLSLILSPILFLFVSIYFYQRLSKPSGESCCYQHFRLFRLA